MRLEALANLGYEFTNISKYTYVITLKWIISAILS